MHSNLVMGTLASAMSSLWSTFGPLLVVGGGFCLLAVGAFIWRRFTNVG